MAIGKTSQLGRQVSNVAESNSWRLLFMAVVTSFFPVLQIFDIYEFTSDQIAILMAFINNLTLMVAYVINSIFEKRQLRALLQGVKPQIPIGTNISKYEHSKDGGGICTTHLPQNWDGKPSLCNCEALELIGVSGVNR